MEAGWGEGVAEVRVGGGEAAEFGVVEAGLEVVEPRFGIELVAGVGEAVPIRGVRGDGVGIRVEGIGVRVEG